MNGPKKGIHKVFIGNLKQGVKEPELRAEILKYIGSLHIVSLFISQGSYAFLNMDSRASVIQAAGILDNKEMFGRKIRAKPAACQGAIKVMGIPSSVGNKALTEGFSQFGEVQRAVVAEKMGQNMGWGIVEFVKKDSLAKAVEACSSNLLLLSKDPCPVIVEPYDQEDTEVGMSEGEMARNHAEEPQKARFCPPSDPLFYLAKQWHDMLERQTAELHDVESRHKQEKSMMATSMKASVSQIMDQIRLEQHQQQQRALHEQQQRALMQQQLPSPHIQGGLPPHILQGAPPHLQQQRLPPNNMQGNHPNNHMSQHVPGIPPGGNHPNNHMSQHAPGIPRGGNHPNNHMQHVQGIPPGANVNLMQPPPAVPNMLGVGGPRPGPMGGHGISVPPPAMGRGMPDKPPGGSFQSPMNSMQSGFSRPGPGVPGPMQHPPPSSMGGGVLGQMPKPSFPGSGMPNPGQPFKRRRR